MTIENKPKEKKNETNYIVPRELLIEKRGRMIGVLYTEDGKPCFSIGWFFELTVDMVRLKITSTRFENYQSSDIPVDSIFGIEDYRE